MKQRPSEVNPKAVLVESSNLKPGKTRPTLRSSKTRQCHGLETVRVIGVGQNEQVSLSQSRSVWVETNKRVATGASGDRVSAGCENVADVKVAVLPQVVIVTGPVPVLLRLNC
jgi:hypothetical protein